jgi:hypothetical protein
VLETTAADRIAVFSTYAVGQGMTAVLSALLRGGTVCPFDVRHTDSSTWPAGSSSSASQSTFPARRCFEVWCARSTEVSAFPISARFGLSERITPEDIDAYRRLFASHTRLLIAHSSTETANISDALRRT